MKKQLLELVEQLSEQEMTEAIFLLKELVEKQNSSVVPSIVEDDADALQDFMTIIVGSLTNAMYDLSQDAKRKEEQVLANRLEAYRRKVLEGWANYRHSKESTSEV